MYSVRSITFNMSEYIQKINLHIYIKQITSAQIDHDIFQTDIKTFSLRPIYIPNICKYMQLHD